VLAAVAGSCWVDGQGVIVAEEEEGGDDTLSGGFGAIVPLLHDLRMIG